MLREVAGQAAERAECVRVWVDEFERMQHGREALTVAMENGMRITRVSTMLRPCRLTIRRAVRLEGLYR